LQGQQAGKANFKPTIVSAMPSFGQENFLPYIHVTTLLLLQDAITMFRVKQMIQDKTQTANNGLVLVKGCNAVLDHLLSSLRASREAVVRGVTPLGKDEPLPVRRALRPTTSRLAEHGNSILKEY